MAEVSRPATAFERPMFKTPRVEDAKHLAFIRTLPCVITGTSPVEACHIRYADRQHGKRETGGAEKPSDCWVVPMCPQKHREQHSMNERAFWDRYGIDPLEVARQLFAATGDNEAGVEIIDRYSKGTNGW